ncbi:sensor histidine kinase [uncultured Kordia sp.]|uniref:ATP-binding protein n=1 Tax=uncultured Kordia sp. TaxID=507699 RepID=UPI002601B488|nr:sensor histidine kinase [uncultured Kordia sp.]
MKTENELKNEIKSLLEEEKINFQTFLELSSDLAKYDGDNLRFTTDSGALAHLGRDSIKDHTTAVLELVKNGYDADATNVEIEICIKENDKSYIRISDSGTGMTKEEVLKKWLRIGFSSKRIETTSKKGRRKTGEKGIGRLSADRLGSSINLITKKEGEIFGLKINWNDFDKQGVDLHLIPFEKINSPKINLPKYKGKVSSTGTELIITGLRNEWKDSDLKRLYEELLILISPFRVVKDFKITVKTNLITEYKGEIKSKAHLEPEVEINVFYDGVSDEIIYTLKDKYKISDTSEKIITWKQLTQKQEGKKILLNDIKNNSISQSNPTCGPVMFDLMFYPRDKAMVKDSGFTLNQLKEYLSYNGGVKIYRDNISVKPYGFSGKDGEDWLNLGERQGQNPAGIGRSDWMVKNNQMLGAIYISRDENIDLEDSAAREGLVHNEAYYDLRALVLSGLRLLELHRHKIHKDININEDKPKRPSYKKILDNYKIQLDNLKKELIGLKQKAKENNHSYVLDASTNIDAVLVQTKETEKTIEEVLDKNRTLGGLATIGISSAVFGHETQTSITQFKMANEEAIESLNEIPPDIKEALTELNSSKKHANQVAEWGAFALTRIKRDKRTRKKIEVSSLLRKIILEVTPTFKASGIEISTDFKEVQAKTFPMDIETVLINLLTNAYSACLNILKDRKVFLGLNSKSVENKEGFEIIVSDSGLGVHDEFKEIIWEALYSTKTDDKGNVSGTGLGLTIVQSIVDDLEGVRKVENDLILGGAKFSIWLPLK